MADCLSGASLAINIMDRNLYERANDCRWWALDPVIANFLVTTYERMGSSCASNFVMPF
jgi:hypothetical protein